MLSITDGNMTNNCEDDTTGEPDALKGARPVRKGTERKGLATIPRSQSTLHPNLVDSLKEVVFSRKEHKDPSLAI
jgi:hypothetical protein